MARRQRPKGTGSLYRRGGRGPWIAAWFDHDGRRREASTGTTDRAAAERILAKRVADAALRREGVIDARADQYAAAERKALAEHMNDWLDSLKAKGVSAKQLRQLRSRVGAVLAAAGAGRLSDLSASAVQTAIGELHRAGRSLQTCQHYLRAVKQFSRWLKRDGRIRDDALAHLAGYNAATDRRHERRALDAEELRRLIEAAEAGPPWRRCLSGPDRAMLYRVAAGTGFRVSELASLTPQSFELDADPPTVSLQATASKRRRTDVQPIRQDLAELLRVWLANKPPAAPVWPGRWSDRAAAMLRADLRRARARWIRQAQSRPERRRRRDSDFLAKTDSAGRVADFHSLRVSFITLLVKGGVPVKAAQELARHSTPTLTLGTYTKLGVHDLSGALAALPSLGRPDRERQRVAMGATGTDEARPTTGSAATSDPQLFPQQLEREIARSGATPRDVPNVDAAPDAARNPFSQAEKRDGMRDHATCGDKATGRSRTGNLRFTKPLLCLLSYSGNYLSRKN